MRIYDFRVYDYEGTSSIILCHNKEINNFSELIEQGYVKVIEKLVEQGIGNFFWDIELQEKVADYLVENYGFYKPEIVEYRIRDGLFFDALYSGHHPLAEFEENRDLPKFIPEKLAKEFTKIVDKYLDEREAKENE